MKHISWIAWVVPSEQGADAPALAALREQGLLVRVCRTGQLAHEQHSTQSPASLRVLQAPLFRSLDELMAEYALSELPTLIIANSAEQEADLLERIHPGDEVLRGLYPSRLLLLRIKRLSRQQIQPRSEFGERPDLAHATQTDSRRDKLTDCLLHSEWAELLMQHLRERPPGSCAAVLLLDLDQFKHINDTHGHAMGDLVLGQVAAALRQGLAPADHLGRFDGDGFTVLLHRYDRDTLVTDAQHLLSGLAALRISIRRATPPNTQASAGGVLKQWLTASPSKAEPSDEITVQASAGLSFVGVQSDFNTLLTQADQALQAAKTRGRNLLVIAPPSSGYEHSDSHDKAAAKPHFETTKDERVSPGLALDPLTQLHHRGYFDVRLAREFEHARRHGRSLSLALVDLEQLQSLNKRHGFAAGDQVLRALADLARASVRLVDWVARVGGEEIAIVMPDTDLASAAPVIARLREKLASTTLRSVDGRPLPLAVSIALVALSADVETAAQLLHAAKQQLQQNKLRTDTPATARFAFSNSSSSP
ncbi:GGDEF domain-containing protein [Paucibacter sp. AS339]|uniref:GGDEF domain-containing protein n=1 Tax=Paucibacter hankyongi TaxID=3133434 RepID=UPI0030A3CE6A